MSGAPANGGPAPAMIDAAFPVAGTTLPREHRRLLADALQAWLPWLHSTRGAGVHRLGVVAGAVVGDVVLLSQRARLLVRAPRARWSELAALAGREIDLGGRRLLLGGPAVRELLAHRTLYAEFVAGGGEGEAAFLQSVAVELRQLEVSADCICGRARMLDDGALRLPGFSLMLDGLSPEHSMHVLESGLGAHRRLGCGLFVPHRSAAAVGG